MLKLFDGSRAMVALLTQIKDFSIESDLTTAEMPGGRPASSPAGAPCPGAEPDQAPASRRIAAHSTSTFQTNREPGG